MDEWWIPNDIQGWEIEQAIEIANGAALLIDEDGDWHFVSEASVTGGGIGPVVTGDHREQLVETLQEALNYDTG